MDCKKIPENKKLKKKVCQAIEKNKKWAEDAGIGFWVFIIIIFVLGFLFTLNIEHSIRFFISGYGLIAVFILSILLDFLMQPVGPDIPLIFALLNDASNPWLILAVVVAGSHVALFFSYLVGKKIGSHGIKRLVGKKNYKKVMKSSKYGIWFLFLGALSPIPYIPYLAGMWKLSFKQVVAYMAIPRTVRFAIVMLATTTIRISYLNWIV